MCSSEDRTQMATDSFCDVYLHPECCRAQWSYHWYGSLATNNISLLIGPYMMAVCSQIGTCETAPGLYWSFDCPSSNQTSPSCWPLHPDKYSGTQMIRFLRITGVAMDRVEADNITTTASKVAPVETVRVYCPVRSEYPAYSMEYLPTATTYGQRYLVLMATSSWKQN
ncbi:hypothetical protein ACTFIV_007882 [Dictyostelium citrinum]